MLGKQDVALRKRQQIASASRLMFIWVAAASVVIGASAVLMVLFAQKIILNEKVLAAKQTTVSNLDHDNQIVDQLKDDIRVLNTDDSLNALKVPADKDAVQVVFDSLPSTPNSAALGSSLQSSALLGQPNIKIESLSVTPIAGVEDSGDNASSSDQTSGGDNSISFEFSISTDKENASGLKTVMQRLERSIRAINVTQLKFERQGERLVLTASGYGYYQPGVVIELQDKKVTR